MQFGLNESQEFLRDSARKFFAGECPISEVRRLLETDTAFDSNLWTKLAEQGYTGIIFPEEFGGVGLGIVELILLMEESWPRAACRPFLLHRGDGGEPFRLYCNTGAKREVPGADLPRRGPRYGGVF